MGRNYIYIYTLYIGNNITKCDYISLNIGQNNRYYRFSSYILTIIIICTKCSLFLAFFPIFRSTFWDSLIFPFQLDDFYFWKNNPYHWKATLNIWKYILNKKNYLRILGYLRALQKSPYRFLGSNPWHRNAPLHGHVKTTLTKNHLFGIFIEDKNVRTSLSISSISKNFFLVLIMG